MGTAKCRHFAASGYDTLRSWIYKRRLNRKGAFAVIDGGYYVRTVLREIFNDLFEAAFRNFVKCLDFYPHFIDLN